MRRPATRPWIVLKFGGTSVARAERWARIAERVTLLLPTHRVWIVVSALAGVSNLLEQAIREAVDRVPESALATIRDRHADLARELGLGETERAPIENLLEDLGGLLTGVRLTGEAPPRLAARILAVGELASSRIGVVALARCGLAPSWVDARELLEAASVPEEDEHTRYLEARVEVETDPERCERRAEGAEVVLTQGFIARTAGETCLLGRGGSDTSGALFAALLGADELQIWTDVPGLFTADPRLVPAARLVRRIGYREAQELAALGAKVLHPRCIEPVASKRIPLTIHDIDHPDAEGTRIEASEEDHPTVTAVTCRTGVTLVHLSTLAMWNVSGFLARAFAPFEDLGVSVDLVGTSQSSLSLTLDRLPGGTEGAAFARLVQRLESLGRVRVVHPCAVVSIVGRRIRAVLHELGPALAAFHERPVHLVSDSSEDLNLSFVVDEEHARALVSGLHGRLFAAQGDPTRLGPTWEMLGGSRAPVVRRAARWWERERGRLVALVRDGRPRYVYHLPTIEQRARRLREALPSFDRLFYAMKANAHPRVLECVAGAGFGIECVSAAEVRRVREVLGGGAPVLFTPNFCPMEEYAEAIGAGALIVVDGPEPLLAAPATFRGLGIGLRIDPGRGLGHHEKVRTAGGQAKFGQPIDELDAVEVAAAGADARIVGLHAHVGSGIFDPEVWSNTLRILAALRQRFPDVAWIDSGGGLGVPETPDQAELDLALLEAAVAPLERQLDGVDLFLEPGRYLVSEAGVLVAPVTQVRRKAGVGFVGLGTGMNSLVRPALYGAWHAIHNLSRLEEPALGYWHVVGPICESADVLGRDRLLPTPAPGDVMLVENAGAYGAVMASHYNLREPAEEVALDGGDPTPGPS